MIQLSWAAGLALLFQSSDVFAAGQTAGSLSLGLGKVFTFFFLTLGPAAVIGPFARETAPLETAARRRVAVAATGISLASVLVAATIGVQVLSTWGISAAALLIAAGIILFLVALQSIRSQYSPARDETLPRVSETRIIRVAFRLAFPYIVSPYGIAIVILVLTIRPDAVPLALILVMLGAIMMLNTMVMLIAHRIARSIYLVPGLVVIASVLSVLQVALGVQMVITGLALADWG